MSLEVTSDDLLALVENIEEWFLLDERGLRWRVGRLRDRIRALEEENARLRAALANAERPRAAREEPALRVASGDPWAVPAQPVAPPPVAQQVAPRPGARFACRRCGELHDEANLRRVEGELICASCDVPGGDDPPVSRGSYR